MRLVALFAALVVSVVAGPARVSATQAEVLKFLSIFITFVLTFYVLTSIVRTMREIGEYVVRLVVVLGTIVAAFAIVESRTGFSPFNHLERVAPVLRPLPADLVIDRGGRLRAFGPQARSRWEHSSSWCLRSRSISGLQPAV